MSKMGRLKKEKIKTTISGLALMIAIGTAGGFGSYAYFSEQVESKNDLIITMGTLSTDILNPVKINVNKGDTEESGKEAVNNKFTIKNEGRLGQHVAIKFNISLADKSEILNLPLGSVNCEIDMKYNGKSVYLQKDETEEVIDNLDKLFKMDSTPIVDENGKPIIIDSENTIECQLIVSLGSSMSDEVLKELDEQNINFNIEVESSQINSKGGSN